MTTPATLQAFEILVTAAIATTAAGALILLGMLLRDWLRGELW